MFPGTEQLVVIVLLRSAFTSGVLDGFAASIPSSRSNPSTWGSKPSQSEATINFDNFHAHQDATRTMVTESYHVSQVHVLPPPRHEDRRLGRRQRVALTFCNHSGPRTRNHLIAPVSNPMVSHIQTSQAFRHNFTFFLCFSSRFNVDLFIQGSLIKGSNHTKCTRKTRKAFRYVIEGDPE